MGLEKYKVDVPEGKSGEWKVEKFTVTENDMRGISYALHGRPVPAGTYTRLMRDGAWDPMMSDTPAEILDHLDFIYEAKGRCLLNGLGLGVVLKALLAKPEVTQVDVVEIEQDVIKLVAPSYNDPRVHIYNADAYTIVWDKTDRWTVAWHDIWANLCSDNLEEMTRLHRKYGHKVEWQGSWGKDLCLSQRRGN